MGSSRIKQLSILVFLVVLSAVSADAAPAAGPVKLTSASDTYPLASKFDYLEDRGKILSVDDVRRLFDAGRFATAKAGQTELGYTQSAYWIRYQVENLDNSASEWHFELWSVPTERADMYIYKGGQLDQAQSTGHVFPGLQKRASYYDLPLTVTHGESRVVFLRLESMNHMRAAMGLYTSAALAMRDYNKQGVMGLLFGICFGLLIYNLFLYFSISDASYLFYVIYGSSVLVLLLGENGYIDLYLGAILGKPWHELSFGAMAAAVAAAMVFARSFLKIRDHNPKLDFWIKVLIGLGIGLGILSFSALSTHRLGVFGRLMEIFSVISIASLIWAALGAYQSGYRPARFFLFSWTAVFIAVLIWFAEANGLVPTSLFTRFAIEIGVSLEMLLMSLGLGDRIAAMREELVTRLGAHNQELEMGIRERTTEINALYERAKEDLHARDEFISIASHELKTPLTSLYLRLQMASRALGSAPGSDVGEDIQGCEKSTREMSRLVDNLLDVTRIRLGRLQLHVEESNLTAIVGEAISHARPMLARDNITLTPSLEGPLLGRWDTSRISQVFGNLLSNAIKYGEGKPIEVGVRAQDGCATLMVKDFGQGIPRNLQMNLFSRFTRNEGSSVTNVRGLGLGLYVSRVIVEAHGGTLRLQCEPGLGTVFIVRLPLPGQEV